MSPSGLGIEFAILVFFGWNFAQVILSILKVIEVTIPAKPKQPANAFSWSFSLII